MSWLLRSNKASASASLSRTFSSQIGSQLFHRNTATLPIAGENPSKGNLNGLPKDPVNKLGSVSNDIINSLRYKGFGLAGVRYGIGVWAANVPMLLGVNAGMARSFVRGVDADTLGLTGHKRFMSDIPTKTSETKPYGLRPLSPHLPVYQPQLNSTLSIFNRIAGASLAAVILLFYMIYVKMGLISLTYESFYQFVFYSSKLNLLVMEISALAMSYHLYSAIRHLFV